MTRITLFRMSGLLCLALILTVPVMAAKREPNASPTDHPDVTRVLRAERAATVDRRTALTELLDSRSDITPARWQAGFVREGADWRAFDAPAISRQSSERLEQYRSRREAAPATRAGQMQLADWCRDHGLLDQERAHLISVLQLAPDENLTPVLERLGFRNLGGRWLSREQLTEWRESNRQAESSLKRFGPRLEKISRQVAGGMRQRVAGIAALRDIKDPAAIPAIELTLANRSESAALAVVETLTAFDGYEASVALAKQAVFSDWPSVCTAAARALKSRPFEHFVPQLTALLSTPIEGKAVVGEFGWREAGRVPGTNLRSQTGVLEYAYVMKRETGDQIQVARLSTINSILDDYLDGSLRQTRPGRSAIAEALIQNSGLARGANDAARAVRDDLHRKELEVERQNEFIHEMNERVGNVLATVSGQSPSAQPQAWWNWWNHYNDIGGDKPVVRIVDENETFGNLAPSLTSVMTPVVSSFSECLVAGTPVWTETGPVAIETICVGDRVLAKNVETGELAYKPVVQTTIRPPKELHTIRVGEETIVCTGGHRFWNSGSGWVRARDLAAATLVHTATGSLPILSVKEAQPAVTYNLVVADFHTYFVGKTAILSQDVQLPRPTNKVVPGLDRSQLAADQSATERKAAQRNSP